MRSARRYALNRCRAPARTLALIVTVTAPLAADAEPFIGQFELKTLESEPGSYEFQSQNAWARDHSSRRVEADGADGLLFDENSIARARHALELEVGFTRALKARVGVEFESERIDEPETIAQANDFEDLELSEIGAEIIAILAPREGDGAGVGVVAEIEGPLEQEEPNHLTLGAIAEFQSGRWFAAAVPMLVHAFGGDAEEGERVDEKWDFAYAAQIEYELSESWSLALEGYGTVERVGDTGHPSEAAERFGDFDQHRVGPVLYYSSALGDARGSATRQASAAVTGGEEEEPTTLTIGVGLLEGLNGNTPDHTFKLSIEVQF